MADEQTKILIEMQLDVKNLKAQIEKYERRLDKFGKNVAKSGEAGEKAAKKQGRAVEDAGKKSKKAADEAARAEKARLKALEDTNKALKEQVKLIREQAKELAKSKRDSGIKGFAGGLLAGAGLGMLTKTPTARGAGGFMGRGISGLGRGLLNFGVQGAVASYQQAMAFGAAKGGLIGMGVPRDIRGATGKGARLGFDPIETIMQARMVGQATGNIGAVTRAQEISRGYGMDIGQVGGAMGMIRQAGFGFGGATGYGRANRQGERQLAKVMEAGIVSGLEKGRLPEFIQGVARVTQQVGGRVTGKVNVADIAGFQAMLGRTGLAGFKGARGAQVVSQLGQAILQPGGGEAGQAMMLQALGFGKPGGQRTYYEALRTQQRGMDRPDTVRDLFTEVYSQLGQVGAGGRAPVQQEANIALSEMTGLSLQQVEELGELLNSGQATEEEMQKVREILEETKDPQKLALEEMKKGFGGIVTYQAQMSAQQIAIGARSIDLFTSIQQAQVKLLEYLTRAIPTITDILKKIWAALAAVGKMLGLGEDERKKTSFMDLMKSTEDDVKKAYADSPEGKNAKDRLAQLAKQDIANKKQVRALLSSSVDNPYSSVGGAVSHMWAKVTGGKSESQQQVELRQQMLKDATARSKKIAAEKRAITKAVGMGAKLDTPMGHALLGEMTKNESQFFRGATDAQKERWQKMASTSRWLKEQKSKERRFAEDIITDDTKRILAGRRGRKNLPPVQRGMAGKVNKGSLGGTGRGRGGSTSRQPVQQIERSGFQGEIQ